MSAWLSLTLDKPMPPVSLDVSSSASNPVSCCVLLRCDFAHHYPSKVRESGGRHLFHLVLNVPRQCPPVQNDGAQTLVIRELRNMTKNTS